MEKTITNTINIEIRMYQGEQDVSTPITESIFRIHQIPNKQ